MCLLAIGLGALVAMKLGEALLFWPLMLLVPASIVITAVLMGMLPQLWWAGVFTLPFFLFGMTATRAYHYANTSGSTPNLYAVEVTGFIAGLIIAGPWLVAFAPLSVLGDVGVTTHLKQTVQDHGLATHTWQTDAYARTDFITTSEPGVAYAFTDGMFVTRSVDWDGQSPRFNNPEIERLATLKRIALSVSKPSHVALLGAGAGFDIAVALQEGAEVVEAIEINPATVRFAQQRDRDAGGLFERENVSVVIDDARRYMQRTTHRYDHINLTLLETSPAAGRARHHVDARVLTTEALQVYAERLHPGGVISVIQNTEALAERTAQTMHAAFAGERQILTFQLPGQEQYNPFSFLVIARPPSDIMPEDAWQVYHADDVINPSTDDRPFFFEREGVYLQQTLLVATAGIILILMIAALNRRDSVFVRHVLAAGLVGAAALAMQVLVIYRCQAALGFPSLALSVGIASLLGGAAVGAYLLGHRFKQDFRTSVLFAVAAVILYVALSSWLVSLSAAADTFVAAVMIGGLTALCALPQGLPFLALIEQSRQDQSEGAIIAFDGLGGVTGAALGALAAMLVGFTAVGLLAGLMLAASLVFTGGSRA